ncbi:NADPH:quinone oxidoreductase family protein (plasmid) [Rhodococcus pyridinivorans]|uniref:NADPH:quinone oxidoreductase family protein n=1 Tax=Rhodococcus pyridinivorans TaxID=103816 RepID=UPI001C30DF6B|nr:NADPH:quinone oxidoreductase family protein [Rhodococcus pyridinivorans]QXF84296.1 NADPH:quinone oxidoreductase family protein [Rhodococcus pyridinivorans]
MKALVVTTLDGPSALIPVEVDEPAADESTILVEVHAVGVSFPDLLLTQGLYQYKPKLPFVPGGEIAGIVLSAPDGSGFSPGDRVVGLTGVGGAMAEVVALQPEATFLLPGTISMPTGAALLFNYLTVHFALIRRAHLEKGESVLVQGAAGGIGTAAMTLAPCLGASRTIAVVSSEIKAEYVRNLGASDVLATENWRDEVLAITDGRGVDVVVDPVGGDRFTDNIRSLATGGRILVMGFTGRDIPSLKVNRLLLKNAAAVGVAWGSWWAEDPGRLSAQWSELFPLLETGELQIPEPTRYPFDAAPEALLDLEHRRTVGKSVLVLR